MDTELQRYLNDHLAGATGAVVLIQELADRQQQSAGREFFLELKGKVEGDRDLLTRLLTAAGMQPSSLLQVMGGITARAGRLKLLWEGLKPGELGIYEAYEMLALGIQGKRLLWLALAEIRPWFPEWEPFDFADLEREAIAQRDAVEHWRIAAAREVLPGAERQTGGK